MNIPEYIAKQLIDIYNNKKLPYFNQLNTKFQEGFTQERIKKHPDDSLFQIIILASYDRTPFSIRAHGWEQIWGVSNQYELLPPLLRKEGLFDLQSVLNMQENEIDRRLSSISFYRLTLNTDGKYTQYKKTFIDTRNIVYNKKLLTDIKKASKYQHVENLFNKFDGIHGIGPIIASKLVMYTLREYSFCNIDPKELYPAVKPILKEYHNNKLSAQLAEKYIDPQIIDKTFAKLCEMGDPYAIDALFYIDKYEPNLKSLLFSQSTIITQNDGGSSRMHEMHNDKMQTNNKPNKYKKKSIDCTYINQTIPEKAEALILQKWGNNIFTRSDLIKAMPNENEGSILPADWCDNTVTGRNCKWNFLHQTSRGHYKHI